MQTTNRLITRILAAAILLSLGISASSEPSDAAITHTATATAAAPTSQSKIQNPKSKIDRPQRVALYFTNRDQPRTWEALGFDLPETAEDSDIPGYLGYVPNVPVTPDQYQLALRHNIPVRIIGDIPSQTPDWDVCYRGYDAMIAYLNSVVTRYPNLAEVSDIGDSYDKLFPHDGRPPHDIWRIRLTNHNIPGPKPKFHLVAAHHAREIATPELAMQWIEDLVTGYGTNADFTWLLDNREIYVVPVENPDGWWQAQTVQTYWRRTDNPNGCSYPNNGVDPNRNYPICWSCPGASSDPCSDTYYGTGAGSEPETQNMMAEYTAVHPNFMISLHTVGPYVLYPWGNSGYGIPTDKVALDAIAWNMGRINNNTPRSRVGQPYNTLYNVSGTTDDWTYSALAIPSFTIELGGYSDFNAPCSVLPSMVNTYKPVLTYALKATSSITQTSYMHGFGPTPNNLAATLNGSNLDVSAVISANYGTTNGAVYRIDQLPEDGIGTDMNMSGQNATASADISGLPDGRHTLFVQGKAAYNYNGSPNQWGVVSAVFFTTTGSLGTSTPIPTTPPTLTHTPTTAPTLTHTPTSVSTPTPCTLTFSDVHPADYFYVAVQYLACHGVISGYADNTFRPFNNTTRGQLTKIIVLAEGWTQECSTQHFTDVPPSNPFYCYVETAVTHGVISGYADGTFKPGNDVTRGQLSKIVVLAEGWADNCTTQHFSDVPPSNAFYCFVETAFAHGIISGYADGTFRPGNNATRGQISKIVYQAVTQP
jgi:hypothetical protein